jgi:hypothetical protein
LLPTVRQSGALFTTEDEALLRLLRSPEFTLSNRATHEVKQLGVDGAIVCCGQLFEIGVEIIRDAKGEIDHDDLSMRLH